MNNYLAITVPAYYKKGDPNYGSQPSQFGQLVWVDNVINPAVIRLFVKYKPVIVSIYVLPKHSLNGQLEANKELCPNILSISELKRIGVT